MIQIQNIRKAFDTRVLFDDYSLNIEDGDFVIISGASGCGKTTLLNIIGSLEPIDAGSIIVDGIDITRRKRQTEYLRTGVGFLFQNFALVDGITVEQNLKMIKKDCRSGISIDSALESVGLSDKKSQKVFSLSGGEQQRVALARLMIKKCKYILADEPTGSLDRKNASDVLNILKDMNRNGKTVILATHDEIIKRSGGKVIEL